MDPEDEPAHLPSLLKCLVECSERASAIAKVFRLDRDLYKLMVQEKKDGEKNLRFVHDVKTFADVLVQEAVKFNIRKKFSHLHKNVYGEETNSFQDARGNSVSINISGDIKETTNSLWKILDEDTDAANLLAVCVHMPQEVEMESSIMDLDATLPGSRIGIWIDPIDSTGEYVRSGEERSAASDLVVRRGLKCVTVLIGAYDISTGCPIMGVVNQPFYCWDLLEEEYKSCYFWGFHFNGIRFTSTDPVSMNVVRLDKKIIIVVSSAEDDELLRKWKTKYDVREVAGAGYKSLAVAREFADLYVLSRPFTYQWDTCAPHALLLSLGGGIVDYNKAVNSESLLPDDLPSLQLKYGSGGESSSSPTSNSSYCNVGGIIAYRCEEYLLDFINFVKKC